MYRNLTKEVAIGNVKIGGEQPCGDPVHDKYARQKMRRRLWNRSSGSRRRAVRLSACAVPTMEAAEALREIKKRIHIPLVADIHFDYRLAIAAIENGADKIRINPGNIGSRERVQAVVDKAKERRCPDPCGRKQRFSGKASAGKVWRRDSGGNRGERAG